MAEQQTCGKCGAVNSADAVTCVNCGTVLAAYAPASVPISDPPSAPPPDSLPVDSKQAPPPESAPARRLSQPSEKSSDWRDLFAKAPGASEPPLSFDSLPAAPAIPAPTESAKLADITDASAADQPEVSNEADVEPVATPLQEATAGATTPESAVASTQPAPSRPRARAYPVPPAPEPFSFDSRMAWFDRGISNRSPQQLILYGILIFVFGCILAMILSASGASDTLAGLLFICAGPLGLIVLVIGIILAVARREGRQR